MVVTDIECSGSEQELVECVYNTLSGYTCDTFNDAGVVCQGMYVCGCKFYHYNPTIFVLINDQCSNVDMSL